MNTINNNATNTADTYENNQIMKTGNASFDAGVEFGVNLGVKIGFKQEVKNSFDTNQLNQFPQEELQFLKATISGTIADLHYRQAQINSSIKRQFNKCNPDDSATYWDFKYLNALRDIQRGYSADIKKLAGIQKKIKSSLRK